MNKLIKPRKKIRKKSPVVRKISRNLPLNGGYITFIIIGIALFAFLLATGFTNDLNPPSDGTQYQLITPTPYGGYNSLELHTLNFISIPPTATTTPPVIANCGSYSPNFNESKVLYSFSPLPTDPPAISGQKIRAWYFDERTLTIGYTANNTINPVSPNNFSTTGGHLTPVQAGDLTYRDPLGYPTYPALFLADVTTNPNATPLDALNDPHPVPPTEIYGTWKKYLDPDGGNGNGSTLGAGSDPFPPNSNSGGSADKYGSEIIWNVDSLGLTPNNPPHQYLALMLIHDGDSNNGRSDVGAGCTTISY